MEEGGGEDSGGIWPRERGSSAHIAAGGHCKMIMGATSVRNDFLPLGGTGVQGKRCYVDLVYSPFSQA